MTDLDALAAAAEEAHVFGPDHEKLPFNECRYEPCVRRRAAVEERDRLRAALEEVGRIASHHRSHQRLEHCMPEEIVAELYDVLAALHREDGT